MAARSTASRRRRRCSTEGASTHVKVSVPKNKLGVVIGKKGRNLKWLSETTHAQFHILKKEGAVVINGSAREVQHGRMLLRARICPMVKCDVYLMLVKEDECAFMALPLMRQNVEGEDDTMGHLFDVFDEQGVNFPGGFIGVSEWIEDCVNNLILYARISLPTDVPFPCGATAFATMGDLQSALPSERAPPELLDSVVVPFCNQDAFLRPDDLPFERAGTLDLVVFCIATREGANGTEILMVQERTGQWFLPAGHVDPGESFGEAAVRETMEEAGAVFIPQRFCELIYERGLYSALHLVIEGEAIGDVKTVEDKESMCGRWLELSSVLAGLEDEEQRRVQGEVYRKPHEIGPILRRFVERRDGGCLVRGAFGL